MKREPRKIPELRWASKRSASASLGPAPRLAITEIAGDPGASGWRDQLIRADNRLAMRALLPDFAGKIDLVYVDPPFGTGGSFTLTPRGAGGAEDVPAYSDRWILGLDDYLSTMLEQLELIRALLSDRGTVFVHCDWHVSHYLRCLLDEVFGADAFKNEIVWRYRRWPAKTRMFQRMHDVIFWYGRDAGDAHAWTPLYEPLAASTLETWGTKRQIADFSSGRRKPSQTDEESRGAPMSDVWDIGIIAPIAKERVGYPTQKPEALLRRVIEAASRPGDLVADFFVGSGTTLSVAHKLGRRFIGCDVGRVAIHAARKRLLGLGASFTLAEIEGARDDASPPAISIRAEPAGDRGAVRVHLDGDTADAVDYWAVDWDHDGHIFRTGFHASREGKKRTLPLSVEHAYAAGGHHRIAVQVAGVHGGEGRHEIEWTSE
ncbi:Type III restriction-modification system methylation subunit protein [Minicystis rosea]|nr:Type III restriction-modification system methylation subunit protein [Minicystis rosea]